MIDLKTGMKISIWYIKKSVLFLKKSINNKKQDHNITQQDSFYICICIFIILRFSLSLSASLYLWKSPIHNISKKPELCSKSVPMLIGKTTISLNMIHFFCIFIYPPSLSPSLLVMYQGQMGCRVPHSGLKN